MDKQMCCVRVSGEGQWGDFNQRQCQKPANVERNGKWYCKIHDPEYQRQKDAEREAKRKATDCPNCGSRPKSWWAYCPLCGIKYSSRSRP